MKALVFGGSGGIGRAIAENLATRGHALGIVARTASRVDEVAATLGPGASGFSADVLNLGGVKDLIRRFADAHGGLDTLVYAAGRFRAIGPLEAVESDEWWADVETTLRGFGNVVREAMPHLRSSTTPSVICLIGPGHARELAFGSGYGAAQAGLARLVESLVIELRPDVIPVYAVNPGLVPTAMMGHLLDSPEGRRWLPRFTEAFAEGKEVGPEVAAEMVAWLAETRPAELSGRVTPAMITPALIADRLGRIAAEDLGSLRLR